MVRLMVENFAPIATYLDVLVMKDGKFIGNTGQMKTSGGIIISGPDRLDYFCKYQEITKLIGKLVHKAYYVDITDIPNGERLTKDPTVPAWLSEYAA